MSSYYNIEALQLIKLLYHSKRSLLLKDIQEPITNNGVVNDLN